MFTYKCLTRKYHCIDNYKTFQMCRRDLDELFAEPVNHTMVGFLPLI